MLKMLKNSGFCLLRILHFHTNVNTKRYAVSDQIKLSISNYHKISTSDLCIHPKSFNLLFKHVDISPVTGYILDDIHSFIDVFLLLNVNIS